MPSQSIYKAGHAFDAAMNARESIITTVRDRVQDLFDIMQITISK